MKIHIFGASGAGTSSLGVALAKENGVPLFDSDNYYWKKTDPPFTTSNFIDERQRLLQKDLNGLEDWVLSGSMSSWSEPFVPLFDIVVFVLADKKVRELRLREREFEEFGHRIKKGGDMYDEHEYFIKWTNQYEEGLLKGRSLARHKEWIKTLNCPIISIKNNGSFEDFVLSVKKELSREENYENLQ